MSRSENAQHPLPRQLFVVFRPQYFLKAFSANALILGCQGNALPRSRKARSHIDRAANVVPEDFGGWVEQAIVSIPDTGYVLPA